MIDAKGSVFMLPLEKGKVCERFNPASPLSCATQGCLHFVITLNANRPKRKHIFTSHDFREAGFYLLLIYTIIICLQSRY